MGVDICYFIDHDLPNDNALEFLETFKNRVNGKEVILHDVEKLWFAEVEKKNGVWYILYSKSFEKSLNNVGEIRFYYKDDILELELDLYKKVIDVCSMQVNEKNIPTWHRHHEISSYYRGEEDYIKGWIKSIQDNYKKYLVPLFHSKEVLLTADSSNRLHETVYGDYLMGRGMSIEEALSVEPCIVLRNYDCFKTTSDENEPYNENKLPFYIFDL